MGTVADLVEARDIVALREAAARGRDINEIDSVGWTPLIKAVGEGRADLVRLLLELGASPEVEDAAGWTALDHAHLDGQDDIVELLEIAARR